MKYSMAPVVADADLHGLQFTNVQLVDCVVSHGLLFLMHRRNLFGLNMGCVNECLCRYNFICPVPSTKSTVLHEYIHES